MYDQLFYVAYRSFFLVVPGPVFYCVGRVLLCVATLGLIVGEHAAMLWAQCYKEAFS
jgi:hypothetical protein